MNRKSRAFTGLEAEKALTVMSELAETVILKAGAEGSWLKRNNELIKVLSIPCQLY